MAEPIDHAAEARKLLAYADKAFENGADDTATATCALAAVHAQLAANDIADRAHELKRIEILAHISYGPTILDENRSATVAESEVWQALHDQTVQHDPLAPSIAASLGLGGESDGE